MPKLFYPAIFHPEKIGYSVVVPDIDGCFSEGDTLEEAVEMTCNAIGLCLEECQGNYPVPSNPANIQTKPSDFISLVPFEA